MKYSFNEQNSSKSLHQGNEGYTDSLGFLCCGFLFNWICSHLSRIQSEFNVPNTILDHFSKKQNNTKNHHHTVSIYQFITLINLNVQNIKDGEENKVLTVQLKIHHCLRVSEWNLKGLLLPVWSRLHFGLFLYPNAKKLQSSCSDSNVPSSADHHHQSHHPAVLRGHKQKKQSALTAKLSLSHLFFFPQEGKDPQSNFKQHSLFLLFQSLCQS